jgi:hypothetical protein
MALVIDFGFAGARVVMLRASSDDLVAAAIYPPSDSLPQEGGPICAWGS